MFETIQPDRRAAWIFAAGCLAVTLGVVSHLPMFGMARAMNYRLAGMPMGLSMIGGMVMIVGGVLLAGYGLLPRNLAAQREASVAIDVAAPEDAPLTAAHWRLMLILTVALIIDVMKPASLGFTLPGMIAEYGVPRATVSLVPFFALLGTVVGSFLWGVLADIYGRKATILLSAVMFVGTSICGAMPSLAWNIGMCFMMGLAAGGMLPVTYALLAEMMPTRHRGWSLVLVGGLGAVGGYFAASGISALLQPIFGWRILWLMNLPTGLALVLLGTGIPESCRFLLARGRYREAEAAMVRFGAVASTSPKMAGRERSEPHGGISQIGEIVALTSCGFAWGLVNFGLLLWLPADLLERGYSIGTSSALLAKSALIACPTVVLAAALYSRWSSKGTLMTMIAITFAGLLLVLRLGAPGGGDPVLPVALLIVGTNGIIAVLLPYVAEVFPLRVRGRATGWVAACTKGGGLIAQGVVIAGTIPTLGLTTALVLLPTALALVLVALFGMETRGRHLR